jgi:hypothetical protein
MMIMIMMRGLKNRMEIYTTWIDGDFSIIEI